MSSHPMHAVHGRMRLFRLRRVTRRRCHADGYRGTRVAVLHAVYGLQAFGIPEVDLEDKVLRVDIVVCDFSAVLAVEDHETDAGGWSDWAAVLWTGEGGC